MPLHFSTAREAEAYLLGLVNYEVRTQYRRDTTTHDLAAFEARLREAGWRPGAVPTIHVGGTNGKGSTAMLMEALLRGGGKRTGLYTSPHLLDIRERIRIDGKPIAPQAFCTLVEDVAAHTDPHARGIRTTFEYLTAAAFLAFQREGVDWAVIEVGLGGRLDATNVLPPGRAVLTPISLDHQNVLGGTVEAIADDKAHILKAGGRAWIMEQIPEALAVVQKRLGTQRLALERPGDEVAVHAVERSSRGTTFRIQVAGRDYGSAPTRLLGEHQAENLAAALAVCRSILTPEELARALASLKDLVLPARMHVVERWGKTFIVDGGHNPGAAAALRRALDIHFQGRAVTGVIGMARDKDIAAFLVALGSGLQRVVATASRNPRAARPTEVAACAGKRVPVSITSTVTRALDSVAGGPDECVLVTGSFIVAGEALAWLGSPAFH